MTVSEGARRLASRSQTFSPSRPRGVSRTEQNMTDKRRAGQTRPVTSHPDPRLRSLDKMVGTWSLTHRAFETGEEWHGQDTFEWMDGGFFLAFSHEEFGTNVKGVMLIGYERRWGQDSPSNELIGHWFEGSTGNHFDYIWEVGDDTITFWLESKDSPSAFRGTFSDDRNTITGAWTWPGGGYELTMTRVLREQPDAQRQGSTARVG